MLLDDIINLATDNQQSITVLLRKCIVLAHQLKNDRLKLWVNKELNGYEPAEEIPEYRKMPAPAKGTFVWGAYQGGRNIPPAVMEKEHRWAAESVELTQPVSAYESIVSEDAQGTISYPWDNNMVLYYQQKLISGYVLIAAWQKIPRSAVAAVLDTIRTRVLNMALEIQSEIGDADVDLKSITPEESKKIDQTIITQIYGGNVYMSTGQSSMTASTVQQEQNNIVAGDGEHLSQVLRGAGVSEPELDELSLAVKHDEKKLGSKVKEWIAKVGPKVLSGGVKIGATVGQTLLLEYLKQYYGLS
jgi:hypothetical protein